MIEYFRRLFEYDGWANREVLASLRRAATPRSLERMAHIVSTERVWLERIRQQAQPFPVWPDFSLEECEAQAATAAELWKNYLAESSEAGLATAVSYINTVGEKWASRVEDILTHVIMHSTYHRGQIATDMRASGLVPAHTDFIFAIRQGLVE